MGIIDALAFGCFLALLAYSGLRHFRGVRSESAYLLAERRTGLFALTATLVMTEFNTTTLLAFSSVGYFAGWWGLSLPFVFLAGLSFYSLSVARQWKRFDGLSTAQLFTERYGIVLGRFAAVSLLGAMTGFSATYVKSLLLVFQPLLPDWNPWLLSLLIVLVVLAITLRGGLPAVIGTDIYSFVAILIVIPAMAIAAMVAAGSDSLERVATVLPLDQSLARLPPAYVLSLIILCCFTYIAAPWYGQKIFAADSERTAFTAVAIAAVLVFVLYGAAVVAVAFVRVSGVALDSPEEALPHLVRHMLPAGLRGLAYGVLFAAGATTLAGVWSAMSSMVVGDFLGGRTEGGAGRGILLTLLFAGASYALANTLVDNVLQKLILANIPVAALSFALLAGFHWKRASRFGALVSTSVGLGWGLFTYLHYGEAGLYTWHWAVFGIPMIFATGIAGSLLWPDRPDAPAPGPRAPV